MTVDAGRGEPRGQLARRRGAGGEQGDVEAGRVGGGGVLDGDLAVAPRQRRARRPGRGEVAQLVDGEAPLGEQPAHHATDLTSCTDDTDTHGRTG